jgi:hypothetical protein
MMANQNPSIFDCQYIKKAFKLNKLGEGKRKKGAGL